MKDKDKELDDIFKDKLKEPLDPQMYREEDWDALEAMLDKQKPRGLVFWLPLLSGVAALLLLVGSWLFIRSNKTDQPVAKHQIAVNRPPVKNQTPNPAANQLTAKTKPVTVQNRADYRHKADSAVAGNKPLFAATGVKVTAAVSQSTGNKRNHQQQLTASSQSTTKQLNDDAELKKMDADNKTERAGQLLAANPVPLFNNYQAGRQLFDTAAVKSKTISGYALSTKTPSEKIKIKSAVSYHPQYALTILAAPDFNGVGTFQQAKVGTNVGAQFSAGISKRLSITTGALYSVKPYSTDFANYHTGYQFSTNPEYVTADCRMLDIPLNFGYQIYNKHQNSVSVGTGLSSYIMLHEAYTFNYGGSATTGPASYTVPNSGKYFFGIANVNATFQHQVNSRVGIQVQPYLKLPLSNVGYSQVKLQSTGVSVGVSWNLSSLAIK